jgi:hypothetical protein
VIRARQGGLGGRHSLRTTPIYTAVRGLPQAYAAFEVRWPVSRTTKQD